MTFSFRYVRLTLALALSLAMFALSSRAQEGPLDKSEPKGITVPEIIKRFAAKEKEFRDARDQYVYRQDVRVQTLEGETPDGGEYRQVFDVSFDDKGRKVKTVVFSPQSTLQRIGMTTEDFDDIENRLPFVLTSDEIGEYDILYIGQQKQDELSTYVFDIAPKEIVGKKRYFQGRIWVDDHDFQVVKTYGKTVPDIKKKKNQENLFPKFTTWREQVDGKYWFPTYTRAEDTLKFSIGDVKIREIIKYTDYKRFGTKVKVTYQGAEVEKSDQNPDQKPEEKQEEKPQKPQ